MAMAASVTHASGREIHKEHEELERVLARLDAALDRLVYYAEVFADLHTVTQVRRLGGILTSWFPDHCRREEELLLEPVARVSNELDTFSRSMRAEHIELLALLSSFRSALEEYDSGESSPAAVGNLKECGKELVASIRAHVALEERELSGFL